MPSSSLFVSSVQKELAEERRAVKAFVEALTIDWHGNGSEMAQSAHKGPSGKFAKAVSLATAREGK